AGSEMRLLSRLRLTPLARARRHFRDRDDQGGLARRARRYDQRHTYLDVAQAARPRHTRGCPAVSAGAARLDHDEFGSNRSKLINVINSNILARDSREKPVSTFSHPALGSQYIEQLRHEPARDGTLRVEIGIVDSEGEPRDLLSGECCPEQLPQFLI